MKRSIILFVISFCTTVFATEQNQIVLTEASNPITKERLLFIDAPTQTSREAIFNLINSTFAGQVFVQRDSASGKMVGPVVYTPDGGGSNEPLMSRSKAGRDVLIGVGLCAGGCVIVNAIGKKRETPPSGFSARVGEKYVSGSPACLVGAMWIASAGFILKGFFELLMPADAPRNTSYYETDEFIKNGRLISNKTESVDVNSETMLIQKVYAFNTSKSSSTIYDLLVLNK